MPTLTIIGYLVRDPELRFTPDGGKAAANLTIAESSRRRSADRSGWADAEPTYWPVRVWGGYAEHVAESLTAGARVVVVGRTGTRAWTLAEGERPGQTSGASRSSPRRWRRRRGGPPRPSPRSSAATETPRSRTNHGPDPAGPGPALVGRARH
jgi:single stranded DNA-binding protein